MVNNIVVRQDILLKLVFRFSDMELPRGSSSVFRCAVLVPGVISKVPGPAVCDSAEVKWLPGLCPMAPIKPVRFP